MGKILFLTGNYFPAPSPNAICVRKVMLELVELGVEPICITLNNKKENKKEIIENIEIHRVNDRLISRILFNLSEKKPVSVWIRKIALFLSRIKGVLYAFLWPLVSISLTFRYYQKGKELYKKEKFTVVVAVYKGIEFLLAGVLLKIKYPNIKLVCYTLDCMSGSFIPKIRNTNIAVYSIKRWERFVFSKADYICIMQSHKNHYQQQEYEIFKNKFMIMDIPLFELKYEVLNVELNKKTERINLVFTGSMSDNVANPSYFIKILEKIEDIDFVFNIYGRTVSSVISENIISSHLYCKKIFWHGQVSHEIAIQEQKKADILISFGNDNECMIPSKIFEYIGLKKHIIHLYKASSDSVIPYFENYGNATLIKDQENLSEENVENIRKLLLNVPDLKIDDRELLNKFYVNTPKPMADFLSNL